MTTAPLLVTAISTSWENTQLLLVLYIYIYLSIYIFFFFTNNISVCMPDSLKIYIPLDTAKQSKQLPCQKVYQWHFLKTDLLLQELGYNV